MNKKTIYFVTVLFFIIFLFIFEISYLFYTKQLTKLEIERKKSFVGLIKLPDISLSQNTPYIRERSLTLFFDKYKYNQILLPYDKQSFTIK